MRPRLSVLLPLALSAGSLVPGAARAAEPAGPTCGFTQTPNRLPGAPPDEYVGEIDGGPVAVADLADLAADPVSVTLTCALQVGGPGTYDQPDDVTASASGLAVAYLPPTPFAYRAEPGQWIWLCLTVTVTDAHGGTATYYLDNRNGGFATDPATTYCGLSVGPETPSQEVCDLAWPACGQQEGSEVGKARLP